jgi:hypothetical protein
MHIKRRQEGTQKQADNGQFDSRRDIALGKAGPGNGHAAGGQQGSQQQSQRQFRLVGKKQPTQAIGDKGNHQKVDQQRPKLHRAMAGLQQLFGFQAHHHRIHHQQRQRGNQYAQLLYRKQQAGYQTQD